MLGSMNPLVLRVRNGRWATTATAYIASSVVGGVLTGWVLGLSGALLKVATAGLTWSTAVLILGICGVVGAALDAGAFGLRLPTTARQVAESWRYQYRNWIYAIGYGFQIGLGFTTVVTTASVYATFIAMFLVASQPLGIAIGAWFGFTRAISVVSVAGVRNFGQFESIQTGLARLYGPSRIVTIVGEACVGLTLLILVVGLAQ